MADIIIFASGKGGVGKSSLTAGIGKSLAALGKRVLLVDTDIGLQSLDIILGCSQSVVYDWGDIVLGRCDKENAVHALNDYLSLLTCPRENDKAFTPQAFKTLIEGFGDDYDYILIDAPAGIGGGLELACAPAQFGIVVSTADNVCVRSAGKAASVLDDLGIEQTRLVINRFRKKAVQKRLLLNIDSVIDETAVQLIGIVPEDSAIAYGAVGTRGQVSTPAMVRIAKRLTGEIIPLSLKNKEI